MGSSQTTTQRADPWAPAQPFLEQGLRDAGDLYNRGGFNISPFDGPMVAGYDPFRAGADAMTPGATGMALGGVQQGMGALGQAMNPNQQSAQFDQVVQNQINRVMPQVNSSFAGSGMTGSGLHAQNLAQGVSQGVADTMNQNWQANQNRALQAAGMVPGLAQAGFGALDYMRGAGRDRQEQSQNELSAAILQDQQAKTAELNAIQDYLALTTGVGSTFGVQSSRTTGSPGLMGALGFGLQALPLMFSDKRLKEDIKRVGKTDGGLPIFTYKYRGGGPTQMGVMAQDVQKKNPDAVHDVGGLLAVDYRGVK